MRLSASFYDKDLYDMTSLSGGSLRSFVINTSLGHKNISVTTEVYSHLLEETYKEENEKAALIIIARDLGP
ncbi:hypothetical protein DOS80_10965 [Staphylococcus felis]|nr:hypothetical protein DOS60_05210 [Staphylococcus felis]REI26501.1 hypothetical protein DOS80_10965 [Staphylococcus felis]